ncbi:hypothetical protein [Thermococcus nautili]|uniref:hypothetical protein n=1 Tax=Thermococcus nautili TaxID=195522 RepID=UPI0025547976|nr:hypothetical protein [Thermococcus nautili]
MRTCWFLDISSILIKTSKELEIALEEILEHKEARKKWIPRLNKYRKDRRRDKTLQKYENVLNVLLSRWRLDISIPWTWIPLPAVVFVDALRELSKDQRTVKKSLLEFSSSGLIKIRACTSSYLEPESCVEISVLARTLAEAYHRAENKEKAEEEILRAFVETGFYEVSSAIISRTVKALKEKDLLLEEKYQLLFDAMISALSSSRIYSPNIIIELLILPLQTTNEHLDKEKIREIVLEIYRSKEAPSGE